MAGFVQTDFVQLKEVCVCQKEKERMHRARCKSFFSVLDPALLISETATSHLSLVFSFRPSWSSSTPAYGTLLPWGRTMRRPLPVSPFFLIYFLCASLQVQAHSQTSTLSVSSSYFSLRVYIYLPIFPFVLLKKDNIYPPAKWAGLVMWCTASGKACILYWTCIQRNTKAFNLM